jgi:hypothetical protein
MGKSYKWHDATSLTEHYDLESILFIQECEIYKLVDFLIRDRERLCSLVMEAREQANTFAAKQHNVESPPYLMSAEDVYNDIFDDHPAMCRYKELFG